MSTSFHWDQRTVLLYLLGFIYGLCLAAIVLWTAGFLLIFCASAQPRSSSETVDKLTPNYLVRLKRALYWQSEFTPTPQTFRIAELMVYVYEFTFFAIALISPYSLADLSWEGWIFVEHTVALGISLLATTAVIVFWIHHLPIGQTWPQACYRCFSRSNPTS